MSKKIKIDDIYNLIIVNLNYDTGVKRWYNERSRNQC